jgi:hypothetical protein
MKPRSATTPPETITIEPGYRDAWVCICGNHPADDGFKECLEDGTCVEPTPASGWDGLYLCRTCGRVIDQDTLHVIAIHPEASFYYVAKESKP